MTEQQIQSQECHEQHTALKTKVELLFDEIKFVKQFLIGSMFIIFSFFFYAGQQMNKLDTVYSQLNTHIEASKTYEIRLTRLEALKSEAPKNTKNLKGNL